MTLRTSSATRRNVVSRSSVVFTTSATSSRRGSTSEARSICEAVVFTSSIIAAGELVIENRKRGFVKLQITNYQSQIFEHADIRKVSVALRIVQAVADHVGIGNGEADVVRLNRLLAARRLVQQGRNAQRPWLMRLHQLRNVVQRQPGIEDVFDQNRVAVRQRLIHVFGQTDFAQ